MIKKLRINGYKDIIKGEIIVKEKIRLFDCIIYYSQYRVNNKDYFVFETGLYIIGYTDDINIAEYYLDNHNMTYNDYWKFCGRN
jgi:hypothetical protein